MALEVECTVWCPGCKEDKYRVLRMPTSQNGVYQHEIAWIRTPNRDHKTCRGCKKPLSRKEGNGHG